MPKPLAALSPAYHRAGALSAARASEGHRRALGAAAASTVMLLAVQAGAVQLNVPFFSQCDSAWGDDPLGTCLSTVCSHGCAVTSSAMLYRYYGGELDPGELNTCLTDHGGFTGGCLIFWSNSCMPGGVTYAGSSGDIDAELAAGRPVIAQVSTPSISMHFVVITGNDDGEYQINDPFPPHSGTISSGGYAIDGLQLYDGQPAADCEAVLSAGSETIIDDLDPCFVRHGAYWWADPSGYEDHHYFTYAIHEASPDCWAEWRFAVEDAGLYEVSVYLPAVQGGSTQARYVLTHQGGEQPVVVDQTSATGWVSLGEFSFAAGGEQRIALYDNTGEQLSEQVPIGFDAVRISSEQGPMPDGGVPDGGAGGGAAAPPYGGGSAATPPAGVAGSDDGCACVVGPGQARHAATLWVLALAVAALGAGRRRSPRRSHPRPGR